MTGSDLEARLPELLPDIIRLASSAGQEIMRIRSKADFKVQHKQDNSPVTAADFAAHHLICDGLKSLSSWPVLSEEDPDISVSARQQWPTYWLIDPLDGTRDFVAGRDTFSVNIALIHNHISVLGVIQLPVTKECFSACAGHGAWKLQAEQPAVPIHTRQLTDQPPVISVSGFRKNHYLEQLLTQVGQHTIKYIGSSIKSCRVAEGTVDFYPCLGPTSEWDTAAGQCIVEQAGGSMTDVKGNPLRYNQRETLTNPWFIVYGDSQRDWLQYVPVESENS